MGSSLVHPHFVQHRPFFTRHFGLRWRIVTLLLLVSLLPLLLAGIGSFVVFGGLIRERTLQLQRNVVESHASTIDLYLTERLRALELAIYSHSLAQLSDNRGLGRLFEAFNASYPRAFVDLGIIDNDGRHLAYVGPYRLEGKNYASAPWFSTVMTRGSYVSDVFLGYRRVPHCVIAVRRREGNSTWILRATINSDTFNSMVSSGRFGKSGDVFIVNDQGLYQTPPKAGKVLGRALILRPELHQGVRESQVTVESRPMIRTTKWLNDSRWMLVVQQEEAELSAPINRAMFTGALVVLLAVALVAATTMLATWHLVNRIDRATAQRDELSKELLRSAKLASLGELSTGLAHEINNPLAIISAEQTNIADMVSDLRLDDEDQRTMMESVRRCKRQVERCSSITAKMLQFGRKAESRLQPTALKPVLEEITRLMQGQARVRNIELSCDVQPDVPPVVLDATELQQVLVNFINNSMFAINGVGRIILSARSSKEEVALSVKDTGAGIKPEDLDKVFLPFFTTKPVGQGTGLGLSVCYGIVQGWGGTIEAQSEPGVGTTMTLHLPLPGQKSHPDRKDRS